MSWGDPLLELRCGAKRGRCRALLATVHQYRPPRRGWVVIVEQQAGRPFAEKTVHLQRGGDTLLMFSRCPNGHEWAITDAGTKTADGLPIAHDLLIDALGRGDRSVSVTPW